MNHRLRNFRRVRLGRLGLCGRRFRNFAGRQQTQGFWGRQMARQAGRLGRGRFDAGSQYPGLGLRRLLLQRLFPGLRRRTGLWNQPTYSRNEGSESSSLTERVPEKGVPEKHASEAAAVESKTESQHKTGRSRKKRHRGGDIIFGGCAGDALENCQPEVVDSSRPLRRRLGFRQSGGTLAQWLSCG